MPTPSESVSANDGRGRPSYNGAESTVATGRAAPDRCRHCYGLIYLSVQGWRHSRDAATTCLPETERLHRLIRAVPQ